MSYSLAGPSWKLKPSFQDVPQQFQTASKQNHATPTCQSSSCHLFITPPIKKPFNPPLPNKKKYAQRIPRTKESMHRTLSPSRSPACAPPQPRPSRHPAERSDSRGVRGGADPVGLPRGESLSGRRLPRGHGPFGSVRRAVRSFRLSLSARELVESGGTMRGRSIVRGAD